MVFSFLCPLCFRLIALERLNGLSSLLKQHLCVDQDSYTVPARLMLGFTDLVPRKIEENKQKMLQYNHQAILPTKATRPKRSRSFLAINESSEENLLS